MKNYLKLVSSAPAVLLVACAHQTVVPKPADGARSDVLVFSQKDPGGDTYTSRMLINKKYLRIDEGPESTDYLLFNRTEKKIYNVVSSDHSAFVIDSNDVKKIESAQVWRIESSPSQALGITGDIQQAAATYYQYYLSEKPCFNVVAVSTGMEEINAALVEYQTVLSTELAKTFDPNNEHEDRCNAAINILEPAKRYEHGFPIREWDEKGYQRFLEDYKFDVEVPAGYFSIPKDYVLYSR